jgi:predicted branched-subunit amino acid permease
MSDASQIRTLSRRASFAAGLVEILPLLLSALPFGIICGVSAMEAGLSVVQALIFSGLVFAGASQLISTQSLISGAPTGMVVFAALAVNLRFLMYSAAISPYFARRNTWQKLALSYLLTDQAFAMSQRAFVDQSRQLSQVWYYLGSALGLLAAFQSGNLIGIRMGSSLPGSWGLDFSVPLIFCALLTTSLTSRAMLFAAIVAGSGALLLHGLPYMLGVFSSAVLGIAAGFLYGERAQHAD